MRHDHNYFWVHLAAPDFSILGSLWMSHQMPLLYSGAKKKGKDLSSDVSSSAVLMCDIRCKALSGKLWLWLWLGRPWKSAGLGRCPSTVRPVFPVLVFQLSKQQNRTRTTSLIVLGTPPNRTRTDKEIPLRRALRRLLCWDLAGRGEDPLISARRPTLATPRNGRESERGAERSALHQEGLASCCLCFACDRQPSLQEARPGPYSTQTPNQPPQLRTQPIWTPPCRAGGLGPEKPAPRGKNLENPNLLK